MCGCAFITKLHQPLLAVAEEAEDVEIRRLAETPCLILSLSRWENQTGHIHENPLVDRPTAAALSYWGPTAFSTPRCLSVNGNLGVGLLFRSGDTGGQICLRTLRSGNCDDKGLLQLSTLSADRKYFLVYFWESEVLSSSDWVTSWKKCIQRWVMTCCVNLDTALLCSPVDPANHRMKNNGGQEEALIYLLSEH